MLEWVILSLDCLHSAKVMAADNSKGTLCAKLW